MKSTDYETLANLDAKERSAKLKELRLELVRSRVAGKSSKTRTKEIKKAIARLFTVINAGRKSPLMTAH